MASLPDSRQTIPVENGREHNVLGAARAGALPTIPQHNFMIQSGKIRTLKWNHRVVGGTLRAIRRGAMTDRIELEIDRNLYAFLPLLPNLLASHEGEYALLKDQRVVSFHRKLSDALETGENEFQDGLFSIQQVTDKPVELGFFSYADHSR
jgi:hypothetical protein